MSDVIVNLLPLIVGAAVVPLYGIVELLLLQSNGGLRKAFAFVAGGVSVRLVQGILFSLVTSKVAALAAVVSLAAGAVVLPLVWAMASGGRFKPTSVTADSSTRLPINRFMLWPS